MKANPSRSIFRDSVGASTLVTRATLRSREGADLSTRLRRYSRIRVQRTRQPHCPVLEVLGVGRAAQPFQPFGFALTDPADAKTVGDNFDHRLEVARIGVVAMNTVAAAGDLGGWSTGAPIRRCSSSRISPSARQPRPMRRLMDDASGGGRRAWCAASCHPSWSASHLPDARHVVHSTRCGKQCGVHRVRTPALSRDRGGGAAEAMCWRSNSSGNCGVG